MPDVFDTYPYPVKLVLSDLDGTLTGDEMGPLDCRALAGLRAFNERSRRERAVPPVTLVTGRPHSYAEAFARFIDAPVPAIFESGCGLHFSDRTLGREYAFHPLLQKPEIRAATARFKEWAAEELIAKRGAGFIVGKEFALSYAPGPGDAVDALLAAVGAMPPELAPHFVVSRSSAVVDITPDPIDKAAGMDWLLSFLRDERGWDIDVANVAAVGDSFNDLPILRRVPLACVVADAAPPVREAAAYVAAGGAGAGVLEVVERAVALNKRLGFV